MSPDAPRTATDLLEEALADAHFNGDASDVWPTHIIATDWWTRRPILAAVYDWARARLVPPELLLSHVLVELALRVPANVVLPPIIGGPVALNLGIVNVAETGVGKTSAGRGLLASATERDLTGDTFPIGTGEGIAELLIDDDDGARRSHGRPVLIHADEGRALEELIARKGSTLASTLCSAVSGATFGQGNADPKKRRRVPALSYRLAVVLNVQPIHLRGVLAEVDAGLPQRFMFMSGTGHHLTDWDIAEPDRLELPFVELDQFHATTGAYWTLVVPETIRDLIRREHLERLHALDCGESVAHRSHRNLLRLRLAALLAIADHRGDVTVDDWDLSVAPVDASDATIHRGEVLRAELARLEAQAQTDRAVRHGVAVDVAVETSRVERLARKVSCWIWSTPGITRKDVARRLSRDAPAMLDEALELATRRCWIVERSEPGQGEPKRVLYPGEVHP